MQVTTNVFKLHKSVNQDFLKAPSVLLNDLELTILEKYLESSLNSKKIARFA